MFQNLLSPPWRAVFPLSIGKIPSASVLLLTRWVPVFVFLTRTLLTDVAFTDVNLQNCVLGTNALYVAQVTDGIQIFPCLKQSGRRSLRAGWIDRA